MGSWNELLAELEALPDDKQKEAWFGNSLKNALTRISEARGNRHVIFYASGFLQKPQAAQYSLQIMPEEINGFMSVMYGMNWAKNLTLVLHTPGGVPTAAETIVEYLHSKFDDIEVIIPTYAMSAGTMISLSADRLIMGRQSQLGPIDPQMPINGRFVSAGAIVSQFDTAKKDITSDIKLAHVWAPILQSIGPATLQEAENALDYGQSMVQKWLARRMFKALANGGAKAKTVAKYFNENNIHKSHGRRIDRAEARDQGIAVEDLESDQALQDAVLTAYHISTIGFEKTPATKMLASDHGGVWIKNG